MVLGSEPDFLALLKVSPGFTGQVFCTRGTQSNNRYSSSNHQFSFLYKHAKAAQFKLGSLLIVTLPDSNIPDKLAGGIQT